MLTGCGPTAIRVPITRPAEVNTAKFKSIVVADIISTSEVNSDGLAFETELTQALVDAQKFQVLDKKAAQRKLIENNLRDIDLRSQANVAGKVIQSALLVSGTITRYEYSENVSAGDPYKDKNGRSHVEYRRDGAFNISISFQLTDMEDGRVIAVKTIQDEVKDRTDATDKRPPEISTYELAHRCRTQIIAEFMKKILPYQESVLAVLYDDDAMPSLEVGNTKAKLGMWDQAAVEYQKALDAGKGTENYHKAWYDMGLACMYTGKFKEAEDNIVKALEGEPDNYYYKDAFERCKKMAEDYKRLQEQTKSN